MDLRKDLITDELVDRAMDILVQLKKSNKEFIEVTKFIMRRFDECERMLMDEPDNKILRQNYESLMILSLSYGTCTYL